MTDMILLVLLLVVSSRTLQPGINEWIASLLSLVTKSSVVYVLVIREM